jgi:hypothetical protein
MEIPKRDEVILRGLHEHADLAVNIGLFIGAYASLEVILWKLYSHILGLSEHSTIELLGGIQSFAHKLAAVERFASTSAAAKGSLRRYAEIFEEARAINSYRVDLVHGLYMEHKDGSVWLFGGRTDPTRKKGRTTHLKAEAINAMAVRANELGNTIIDEFFGGVLEVTLLDR